MLLSALIDAGASLDAIRSRLPVSGVGLDVHATQRHGISGTVLSVAAPHEHAHRRWGDIRQIIDSSSLSARAKDRAHKTFALLAHAEGRVHRISPEEVTFHEVGAIDAIVDICGVALALDELGVDEVVCSPLPLGHGTINSAHGVLPLPAPATLEILCGAETYGVDIKGETVTPTGAALAASLSRRFGAMPAMTLSVIGTGAGNADWAAVPNVVRALLGQPNSPVTEAGQAALILRDQSRRHAAGMGARRFGGVPECRRPRCLDHAGGNEAGSPRNHALCVGFYVIRTSGCRGNLASHHHSRGARTKSGTPMGPRAQIRQRHRRRS